MAEALWSSAWSAIVAAGLGQAELLALQEVDPAEVAQIVEQATGVPAVRVPPEVVAKLTEKIVEAKEQAPALRAAKRARGGSASVADVLAVAMAGSSHTEVVPPAAAPGVPRGKARPWVAAACRPRGTRRSLVGAGGAASLKARDDLELARWTRRFVCILKEASSPSWEEAQQAENPEAALKDLVGAARPGTVRLRVRAWEMYTRWLRWNRDKGWPEAPVDVVDYVHHLRDLPCSPSAPKLFGAALRWFEERAAQEWWGQGLYNHPLVVRSLERLTLAVTDPAKAKVKAPMLPAALVGALELLIGDEDAPLGLRVVAWARVVKVYGTLRSDDLQRLRPGAMEHRTAGLVARLVQTKTSGVGKRVASLPLWIPCTAWILNPTWLETGYALVGQLNGYVGSERDYLIPRFSADFEHATRRPATAADLAAMGHRVLQEVRVPVLRNGAWLPGPVRMVQGALSAAWTGHAERATLPSALAALGVQRSDRDTLGRWGPEGSDEYVRTYKIVVTRLLEKYVAHARSSCAKVALEEEAAYSGARVALMEKGYARDAVDNALFDLEEKCDSVYRALRTEVVERHSGKQVVEHVERNEEVEVVGVDEGMDYQELPTYVIVSTRRGQVARLHRAGGCWRVRRGGFAHMENFFGSDPPDGALFTDACRRCWPGGPPAEDSSDGDSTSTTSPTCCSSASS